jgi:hypothetical protein
LVGRPAALCDQRQIVGAERDIADHLAFIGGKAKQPSLRRFTQQPSFCHHASSLFGGWLIPALPANRAADGRSRLVGRTRRGAYRPCAEMAVVGRSNLMITHYEAS